MRARLLSMIPLRKRGGSQGDDSSETKCKAKQWRDDNDDVNANVKGIKDSR